MITSLPTRDPWRLTEKLNVRGTIRFETAWRIGTGREGQTMSDLGVMLDPDDTPVLPGSSLKGKLRSTCESLASTLKLSACLLDSSASGLNCTSDVKLYQRTLLNQYKEYQEQHGQSARARLDWIHQNTCDVCKLFGSPVKAARLKIADGTLVPGTWAGVVQVRDGVVLDRDSRTAVDGLKYDYEVVPAGAAYRVRIDLENPAPVDLALLGAALFDWHGGSSLGGFTSRGLGRFHLEDVTLWGVRFDVSAERVCYLTKTGDDRLTKRAGWEAFFTAHLQEQLRKHPTVGDPKSGEV